MDNHTNPIEQFSVEHWHLFASAEEDSFHHNGYLDQNFMRFGPRFTTDLKDGTRLLQFDDTLVLDDLYHAGLLTYTPREWVVCLTDYGWEVAGKLRQHIADGGKYQDFVPPEKTVK